MLRKRRKNSPLPRSGGKGMGEAWLPYPRIHHSPLILRLRLAPTLDYSCEYALLACARPRRA